MQSALQLAKPACRAVPTWPAEASRQASRGVTRTYEPLWRVKAKEDGRRLKPRARSKTTASAMESRAQAAEAWREIQKALAKSSDAGDRSPAEALVRFVREGPDVKTRVGRDLEHSRTAQLPSEATRGIERTS